MENLYPAGPSSVPPTLSLPGKAYKQRAWLAMGSLLFFVLVYLALTAWFCWNTWRLIHQGMSNPEDAFFDFLWAGLCAFLAVFMLKGLFFRVSSGASQDVEVTPQDQPRLFEFLYALADEAGAPRPKRVFLSARVNAAVFYDLSVFNLFFPSGKNLEIGLALVNVLTLSEMKAVLAHEFGHFAQRSMAIGSWVYIAQQIAEQIVAKRDMLDSLLRSLSRTTIRIAWIGWLLSLIVWSIRSLMDTLLRLVVLAQRALSRQMEFQADLVAVSLTGSDELVHALHKLQAADEAWSAALNFAGSQARADRATTALFAVQSRIIEKLGTIFGDAQYGRVPQIARTEDGTHRVFKSGFAQPPQMWSTHPTNVDREENAKRTYLSAPHDGRSAWLLFEHIDEVRQRVLAAFYAGRDLQPASEEESLAALDEYYDVRRYDPRYRGAYLSRHLTRHTGQPDELYDSLGADTDLQQALDELYTQQLADDLASLRDLDEEAAGLKALRDRVYQPTGGRIIFRGRQIARRELSGVITQVEEEAATVRARIHAHDRRARGVHLAAAAALGGGWRDYLLGLLRTLHYAEHALADVRDAAGLLSNVVAIVTADGNVSSSELQRVLKAANDLHAVLHTVYGQEADVQLDSRLLQRLGVDSWTAMLGEFKLPPATSDNINDWMPIIDSWVDGTTGPLGALCNATLDELLATERELANHLQAGTAAQTAPAGTRVPAQYTTLLPGKERKRQQRLGWWDRFLTAEGFLPGFVRLAVALGIVGTFLAMGTVVGRTSQISVFNGLATPVWVELNGKGHPVPAFGTIELEAALVDNPWITTRTANGDVIDGFRPQLEDHQAHYVYNVAAASPLIEGKVFYGEKGDDTPRLLGSARWMTSHADLHFTEPPQTVSSRSGKKVLTVVAGMADEEPDVVLSALDTEEDRRHVIEQHARWDADDNPHTARWKALAQQP